MKMTPPGMSGMAYRGISPLQGKIPQAQPGVMPQAVAAPQVKQTFMPSPNTGKLGVVSPNQGQLTMVPGGAVPMQQPIMQQPVMPGHFGRVLPALMAQRGIPPQAMQGIMPQRVVAPPAAMPMREQNGMQPQPAPGRSYIAPQNRMNMRVA